ncbi:Ureidoglycolate lyase [compost metagenome]
MLLTCDEIDDPQALRISCRINGQVVQSDNTANQIFPVARLIAELSRGMTLLAGDVILTGTPDGIGAARTPPVFLGEGDRIESEIEGIGCMHNQVFGALSAATPSNRIASLNRE